MQNEDEHRETEVSGTSGSPSATGATSRFMIWLAENYDVKLPEILTCWSAFTGQSFDLEELNKTFKQTQKQAFRRMKHAERKSHQDRFDDYHETVWGLANVAEFEALIDAGAMHEFIEWNEDSGKLAGLYINDRWPCLLHGFYAWDKPELQVVGTSVRVCPICFIQHMDKEYSIIMHKLGIVHRAMNILNALQHAGYDSDDIANNEHLRQACNGAWDAIAEASKNGDETSE